LGGRGERRSEPAVDPAGPGTRAHRPLDRQRGLERRRGLFEDGEELVRTGVHLVTTGISHRGAHQTADIREQGSVAIVEAPEQLGGALDIGQQEGDRAFRQLPLRLQLRADEADGHDPVLLARPQQSHARLVPRALVLEGHLAEPRESVPDVRRVVDRQTPFTARVDVRERAVGKLCSLLRAKRWHAQMIARTGAAYFRCCGQRGRHKACWPCKSNSVCLSSCHLPRPEGSIDGLRAFSRNPGRRASPTSLLL
jgi:hypothetical protein